RRATPAARPAVRFAVARGISRPPGARRADIARRKRPHATGAVRPRAGRPDLRPDDAPATLVRRRGPRRSAPTARVAPRPRRPARVGRTRHGPVSRSAARGLETAGRAGSDAADGPRVVQPDSRPPATGVARPAA